MQFPQIDPVFLSLGPLQFRWYGLMYVLAFITSYFLLQGETKRKQLSLNSDDISDLVFYGALGVVIGGRTGYILFYNLPFYISNPLKLLAVWEGGMSFHGGFLGVITAFIIYARKKKIRFFTLIDMAAICAPAGLGFGRIGNFINGELYGRVTTAPWGVIFPTGGELPRHPSQLYEAFLEGLILFIIVRAVSRMTNSTGAAGWCFVSGYGLFRFIVEFFRQPDAQLGMIGGLFSMGQLLSFPMFVIGLFMLIKTIKSERV